jgi:hypothetical protein
MCYIFVGHANLYRLHQQIIQKEQLYNLKYHTSATPKHLSHHLFSISGLQKLNSIVTIPIEEKDVQEEIKPQWFTQKLTHFNSQINNTWLQRYYVNLKYYQSGGHIFDK